MQSQWPNRRQRRPQSKAPRVHKRSTNTGIGLMKRRTDIVTIRRVKRSEKLQKKRLDNFGSAIPQPTVAELTEWSGNVLGLVHDTVVRDDAVCVSSLKKINRLFQHDPAANLKYVVALNQGGLLMQLANFIMQDSHREKKLASLDLVNTLAYAPLAHITLEIFSKHQNIVQNLVTLGYSRDDTICFKACQALGNISITGPECRLVVIQYGTYAMVCQRLVDSDNVDKVFRSASFALMMVTYAHPAPEVDMDMLMPAMERLMVQGQDEEVLWHLATTMQHIVSQGPGQKAQQQRVCNSPVLLKQMMELAPKTDNEEVLLPLLRSMARLSVNKKLQQLMMDAGVAVMLNAMMGHNERTHELRREVCFIYSHLVHNSRENLMEFIKANMIQMLVLCCGNCDFSVKKEALLGLANSANVASEEMIHEHLVPLGIIEPFVEMLTVMDDNAIYDAIKGLETILAAGEILASEKLLEAEKAARKGEQVPSTVPSDLPIGMNTYAIMTEEVGGIQNLERLVEKQNDIGEHAWDLLVRFFGYQDSDLENLPPE